MWLSVVASRSSFSRGTNTEICGMFVRQCSASPSVVDLFPRTSIYRISPPHHNHFMALFPGPAGWGGARRELLDFMVQGKINRGRHTDHPAGHHSIWTKQCLPPPSPIFYRPDALPAAQPTVSKHWRQYLQNITNVVFSYMFASSSAVATTIIIALLIQPTYTQNHFTSIIQMYLR